MCKYKINSLLYRVMLSFLINEREVPNTVRMSTANHNKMKLLYSFEYIPYAYWHGTTMRLVYLLGDMYGLTVIEDDTMEDNIEVSLVTNIGEL